LNRSPRLADARSSQGFRSLNLAAVPPRGRACNLSAIFGSVPALLLSKWTIRRRRPGKPVEYGRGIAFARAAEARKTTGRLHIQRSRGEVTMADKDKLDDSGEEFWYPGKVTRRQLIGYGAAASALGATLLVPAPWQAAFGQAKPYRIGSLQPLSGSAAAGGKTALVGLRMAVDRISSSGGINGRPVEIHVEDDESKPDVGRRKTEKLLVENTVDVHVGGFLSNVCLACMPVFEDNKVVNMISVCLDTTLT